MRTVEEIKVDIALCEMCDPPKCTPSEHAHVCLYCPAIHRSNYDDLYDELLNVITSGIPLDRLEAICAAERDGRCVVLPCKVGDTVYKLGRRSCWCRYPNLCHKKINGIRKCERYTPLYVSDRGKQVCGNITETAMQESYSPFIGKTVFLSYEAAQAALNGGAK